MIADITERLWKIDPDQSLHQQTELFRRLLQNGTIRTQIKRTIKHALDANSEKDFGPEGFRFYEDSRFEINVCGPHFHFYRLFFNRLKSSTSDELYLNPGDNVLAIDVYLPSGEDKDTRRISLLESVQLAPGQVHFVRRGLAVSMKSAQALYAKVSEKDHLPYVEYFHKDQLSLMARLSREQKFAGQYYAMEILRSFPTSDSLEFLTGLYESGPSHLRPHILRTIEEISPEHIQRMLFASPQARKKLRPDQLAKFLVTGGK